MARTVQIDRVIEIIAEQYALRVRLEELKGTKTEIYSRIVGFFRSVADWNEGKKAEWIARVPFKLKNM